MLGAHLSVLLVVGLLASPLAVSRASAAPSQTPERRAAFAEFKRGKQLFAAKDYAAALDAFTHGYELSPLRGFLVNIGQCQRRLGQLREAAQSYEKFLEGAGGAPALRAEVEEALAEVREAERSAARTVAARPVEPVTPKVDETSRDPGTLASEESPGAVLVSRERPRARHWVAPVAAVGAILLAGGVAAGVYFGLRFQGTSGGSLGLIDGRSP